jgi:hypothetical protein
VQKKREQNKRDGEIIEADFGGAIGFSRIGIYSPRFSRSFCNTITDPHVEGRRWGKEGGVEEKRRRGRVGRRENRGGRQWEGRCRRRPSYDLLGFLKCFAAFKIHYFLFNTFLSR